MPAGSAGFSVPTFWIGMLLIMGFAVELGWLPSGGRGDEGTFLGISTYRIGEASALAPAPYLRFVVAAVIGIAFFGERPGPMLLLGAALVVIASLLAVRHEMRQGLTAPLRGVASHHERSIFPAAST